MEMLKKLKKRIVPLVLAVVTFATSVVSGPASMTAQAASVAVSPEMSVEFVMMLYNIFETISIASGIKDGLDDYDSGMSLFEAFIGFIDSLAYDPFERFTIYGPQGQDRRGSLREPGRSQTDRPHNHSDQRWRQPFRIPEHGLRQRRVSGGCRTECPS